MMRIYHKRRSSKPGQSGFTLIELMIAMIVLVAGLLALVGLLAVAIRSNGRNKMDSTATMLAQTVLEQINSAMLVGSDGVPNLVDDAGVTHDIHIDVDNGAKLRTSDGNIDFTETSPDPNYRMLYVFKSTDPDTGTVTQATYDVRWHVSTVTSKTYLVTVGSVLNGAPAPTRDLRVFAFPSNLKLMIGPDL